MTRPHNADTCQHRDCNGGQEPKVTISIELVPEMVEPIDAVARRFGWTREKALVQMVDDWAMTFAWQEIP